MVKAFDYPIDIDPDYYAAIGEIAARWSSLEHRLTVLIREGFKVDKAAGRALTASMNASTLVQTARTLTGFPQWITDASLRKDVKSLVDDVEKRREKRNSYVHGVYGPETAKPGTLYRILMRGGAHILAPDGEPIALPDLQAFAKELRDLQLRGNTLSDRLKASQRK